VTSEAPRPAAVLFDLDGTLADSFAAIRTALNAALADHDLPGYDLPWVKSHVGRGAEALVRDAVGAKGGDDLRSSVGIRFGAHYREIYLDQTPPVHGAERVLAFVAARIARNVAVVSNKYEALCRGWLEHWGLARHVAVVVGPDTYGVRKPDPAVIVPVLQGFGVAAADALMVGDMEVDAATAAGSGVPLVGVQGDPEKASALLAAGAVAVLGALDELPGWLATHGTGWGVPSSTGEHGVIAGPGEGNAGGEG
jgi:phosphoglycolate phosphatase